MATGKDRALIERLSKTCRRLDDPSLTSHVFQGLITSADDLYHLSRLGKDRYWCVPNPKTRIGSVPHEVEIEDALMRPLVSGPEAKRYEEPETETWLLFPYARDSGGRMRLLGEDVLSTSFPKAWKHFKRWETELRRRERSAFDDDSWWRFGRHQNVDKQDQTKLIVAQTVPEMRVSADTQANKYLNNVRVNGILAAPGIDQFYLLGVLNGAVVDFVFRRISKPKQGGWYEANKQFIAPLPVPNANSEQQAEVAALALRLQTGWTRRRELLAACAARLGVLARHRHIERWLWPDLPAASELEEAAPAALRKRGDRRAWSQARVEKEIEDRLEALQAVIHSGDQLEAVFADGELRLLAGGAPILNRIFLPDPEGRLVEAYWRWLLLSESWREADALAKALRRPPAEPQNPAADQFIERVEAFLNASSGISNTEAEMRSRLFDLYRLSPEERVLVENDPTRRTRI